MATFSIRLVSSEHKFQNCPGIQRLILRENSKPIPTIMLEPHTNNVQIPCNHSASTENIAWYRQFTNKGPDYLLTGYKEPVQVGKFRLTISNDRKSSVLHIQDVKVDDSVVYLCALRDTAMQSNPPPVQ
uniref:Ig-like domain-containing protein n=1 Tax=Leptobrachium leishanense TaxID=445787 RepID=A0A8C5M886_9ANUR